MDSSNDSESNLEIERLLDNPKPKTVVEKPLAETAPPIAMEVPKPELPEGVQSADDDDADENNEKDYDQRLAELVSEMLSLLIRCLVSEIS